MGSRHDAHGPAREWLVKALEPAPDDPRINANRKVIFPEEPQKKTGE